MRVKNTLYLHNLSSIQKYLNIEYEKNIFELPINK